MSGYFISAVFELSIYNHSNGTSCGRKASYVFHVKNLQSDRKCLIPLAELLNSCEFLVDDSCVFGVKILDAKVHSLKMKPSPVVLQNKPITTQNLFLHKEAFIEGTYTWNMTDFLDLALKPSVLSPGFEVGGYKWHIKMYPRGNEVSTRSMSLYLYLQDELPRESGPMIELTLTILNQIYVGECYNYKLQGRFVFASMTSYGWSNFIPHKTLKSKSGGYLVGSNCIVKADISIIGLSSEASAGMA
ncbi:MATH domain and coiled-coil domain-containing protein At3g58370-like [Lolium perenne]|uniref:MATH domain and coiled-coil domain-containing protein At3g58370-like n=1 Tax=Lolium perenne TaxID=4522 RepID=UPI003A997DA1